MSLPTKTTPVPLLAVTGCVVVGCLLRLTALDVHSLWFDEAGSTYVATAPDLTEALATDRHPPLFFWLLRHWSRAVGLSESALRLLPALASCTALALFSGLCLRRCPPAHAWLAAGLLALSPFSIWFAQELRAYAFLELAGVLALAAAAAAQPASPTGGPRTGRAFVLAALACGIGLGTHYLGGVLVPALVAVAAVGRWRRQLTGSAALALCAGAISGLVVWVPWLVAMLPRQSATSWPSLGRLSLRDLVEFPVRLFVVEAGALAAPLRWLVYGTGAGIYLGLGVALWRGRRDHLVPHALVIAAVGIGTALVLALTVEPNFLPRYLAACAPALVFCVAGGVAAGPSRTGRVAIGLVLLAGALVLVGRQRSGGLKQDFRSACRHVENRWQSGDRVMAITGTRPEFSEAPVRYYLRGRPDITGSIVGEATIPRLAAGAAPGTRIHVVVFDAAFTKDAFGALAGACRVLVEEPGGQSVRYVLVETR